MVAIDSLIAPFLGDDPALATFADLFSISPRQLPLTEATLDSEDPRRGLPGGFLVLGTIIPLMLPSMGLT